MHAVSLANGFRSTLGYDVGYPNLKLEGVQALRAIAATSVVLHHVTHDMEVIAGARGVNVSIQSALPFDAGVDLFFLISGFIMAVSCDEHFARHGAARSFMSRRLVRIVPLYWTTTLLFVGLMLLLPAATHTVRPNVAQIVSSLLFWPQRNSSGDMMPAFPLGWTLNYEMLFYALFAVSLLFRRAMGYCFLAGALLGLVGLASLRQLPVPLQFWGNPIVLEFLVGAGLGYASCRGLAIGNALQWALILGGMLALVAWRHLPGWPDAPRLAKYGLPCALIIGGVVLRNPAGASWLPQSMIELGDASYSLYLLHLFVLRAAAKLIGHFPSLPLAVVLPIYAALSIAGSIAVAFVSYAYFEQRITEFAHHRLRRFAWTKPNFYNSKNEQDAS